MTAAAPFPGSAQPADALARMVVRTARPWLDEMLDAQRDAKALIAAGDLEAGVAAITPIVELEPPPYFVPLVRQALERLKEAAIADVLAAAVEKRGAR